MSRARSQRNGARPIRQRTSAVLTGMLMFALPIARVAAEVPVPPAGASSRVDAIRRRGALRVAVLNEFPWLIQTSPESTEPFHGPAWRLTEEYARRLSVKIETTPVTFDNKVSILANGAVDISVAPLLMTPEREVVVDMIHYSNCAASNRCRVCPKTSF